MRRSAAPSISGMPSGSSSAGPLQPRLRPNASTVVEKSSIEVPLEGEKRFEVVYAKRSSRKHKTWEGDGLLTLRGSSVTLKSTEGKSLGSANLKRTFALTLEAGSRVNVGGYECELISLVSGQTPCKIQKLEEHTASIGTATLKTIITNSGLPRKISPVPETCFCPNSYLMPAPPDTHVWRHNPEGLPVTPVFLTGQFARRLHPYQLDGIKFLYECLMGFHLSGRGLSPDDLIGPHPKKEDGVTGAILADEMGLGKSVQVIGVITMLLKQGPYGGRPVVRRCLIITPGSLVQNWRREFNKWVGRENIPLYCVSQDQPIKDYLSQMRPPPVIIMSYEMFLQHADRVASLANVDLLVCDEGHRLKNLGIKTTTLLSQLPARRRILLTGTPVQNNLNELWSLAEFCAPGVLADSQEEFRQRIVNPLSLARRPLDPCGDFSSTAQANEGGRVYANGDEEEDVAVIEAARRLTTAVQKFMLRRTADAVCRRLPGKTENIVFCRPTELQHQLETVLLKWAQQLDLRPTESVDFHNLGGSDTIRTNAADKDNQSSLEEEEEEEEDELDSDDSPHSLRVSLNDASVAPGNAGSAVLSCILAFRKLYNHPSLLYSFLRKHFCQNSTGVRKSLQNEVLEELLDHWKSPPFSSNSTSCSGLNQTSGKLIVLRHLLHNLLSLPTDPGGRPHRIVLVSNFIQTLDLLEPVCREISKAPCLRIDSKTPTKRRMELVDKFNSPTSVERVFLLSSKAGGTGLNLIGADFLVLFDMDWNPANDAQAMARVWREGQKRPVHLYRLVTAGGLEERIFQRQLAKSSLAQCVVGDCSSIFNVTGKANSQDRLTRDELRELFRPAPGHSACWTHDLLCCTCNGAGVNASSPEDLSAEDDEKETVLAGEDVRAFQLGPLEERLKMNEASGAPGASLAAIRSWHHFIGEAGLASLKDPILPVKAPQICAVFRVVTQETETCV
ncbi:DNA repair and recombination protein rad54b [Sparganum proliferum]